MRSSPIRTFGLIGLTAALVVAGGIPGRFASGQDPAPSAKDTEDEERARRLAETKELAHSLKVVAVDEQGKETPATLVQEPLHRWTDPTRAFSAGSLWAWKVSGRPVAVVGIELYAHWSLEFVSLSTGLVKAEDGSIRWAPTKAGVTFNAIPDAPAPAATEAGRLRQMRDLAPRFSGREYWDKKYYPLRLLPHPIDRYSDPASGVVDGALFIYANGTNPEILLMIEARRTGDGPPQWSFAAAPLSHAEVILKVGARDVWKSPSKDTGQPIRPSDPYYDLLTPRRVPARNR